jgi:hypothetical protein
MISAGNEAPYRIEVASRVRLIPAIIAAGAAAVALLVLYYLTLGLLPPAAAWPPTDYPVWSWAHRFDLSQFLGTILFPPVPTWWTWWVGLAIWLGTLTSCGIAYAILLSWTLQRSDLLKGIGFGIGLCVTLIFGLTLAQGFHPAIMRNALPDVGVLMLGWSGYALLQMLVLYVIYGALLGALYRRWSSD